MTEPKFTPGPWAVHDAGRAEEGWGDAGPSVCREHPDGTCGPLIEFIGGRGRVLANAHLIAAAPLLYDALEQVTDRGCYDCIEFAYDEPGGSWYQEHDCIRALARTALRAARGET